MLSEPNHCPPAVPTAWPPCLLRAPSKVARFGEEERERPEMEKRNSSVGLLQNTPAFYSISVKISYEIAKIRFNYKTCKGCTIVCEFIWLMTFFCAKVLPKC
jgi:hypothetical protein